MARSNKQPEVYTGATAPATANDGDIWVGEAPTPTTNFWDEASDAYWESMDGYQRMLNILNEHGQTQLATLLETLNHASTEAFSMALPEDARERIGNAVTARLAAKAMEQLHEFGAGLGLSTEEMEALDQVAALFGGPTTPESFTAALSD